MLPRPLLYPHYNRLDSNPTERHRQTNKRDSQKGGRNAPPRIHQTTLPTRRTRGKWHEKRRRHLKVTTIKMANYLNNSDDKRIKYARTLEMNRITQGRRSIFKQATKYAAEYNIICNFDDTGTTISASKDPTAAIETKRPPSNHATQYHLQDNNISHRWSAQRAPSNTPIHAD